MATTERPANVGILAMEWYAPQTYVAQTSLEEQDGCGGKYVVGLGQEAMAFVDDREDIGSVLLTACRRLLTGFGVAPADVGRLEVGTETLVDKSKSVKTTLLRLFLLQILLRCGFIVYLWSEDEQGDDADDENLRRADSQNRRGRSDA